MFELKGKKALITGASGGIGGEIARTLHKAGADIAISGTRLESLNSLAKAIGSNIQIFHEGAKSVDSSISFEVELTRNWHWMWSKFYFQKKYYGYFFSLIQVIPKLFSNIFKIILYSLLFNKKKSLVYFYRLRGIISAVLGQSSWYRPRIKT